MKTKHESLPPLPIIDDPAEGHPRPDHGVDVALLPVPLVGLVVVVVLLLPASPLALAALLGVFVGALLLFGDGHLVLARLEAELPLATAFAHVLWKMGVT